MEIHSLRGVASIIVKFLRNKDIYAYSKSSKTNIFDIFYKSLKIFKYWYVKKTEVWINQIIKSSFDKHPFYNRTNINIPNDILPCPLYKINMLKKKKKFIRLVHFLMCPVCNVFEVDTALYFSLGMNTRFSIPHVCFSCRYCAHWEAFQLFDYHHPPQLIYYNENIWAEINTS